MDFHSREYRNFWVKGRRWADVILASVLKMSVSSHLAKKAQISAPLYTQELLGEATMLNLTVGTGIVSVKTDKEFRAQIKDIISCICTYQIYVICLIKKQGQDWI